MKKPFLFEKEGSSYSLAESVEAFALNICEELSQEEKRTEEIMQKCKILDSLSNALISVKM